MVDKAEVLMLAGAAPAKAPMLPMEIEIEPPSRRATPPPAVSVLRRNSGISSPSLVPSRLSRRGSGNMTPTSSKGSQLSSQLTPTSHGFRTPGRKSDAFFSSWEGRTGSRASAHALLAMNNEDRQNLLTEYAEGFYKPMPASSPQMRVRLFVVSLPWLVIQLLAILVDLVTLVLEWEKPASTYLVTTRVTSIIYVIDVLMRVFAYGCHDFFGKWRNWIDVVIVFTVTFFAFVLQDDEIRQGGSLFILRAVRIVRLLRIVNMGLLNNEIKQIAMRQITGENKLRFVSLEEDLDIDLAYVTPQLVAMSVPAEGCITRLYRNDISDVVRFFELFHSSHFLIFNCCPEIPYNPERFGWNPRTRSQNVVFVNVQDHTPPLIEDCVFFFEKARRWMKEHEENILAVHCRGGKGRTGTLCCAWLLYKGEAQNAQDALNIFALARTDIDKSGFAKIQGVETPSQVRYVGYLAELLIDDPQEPIRFPSQVRAPPTTHLMLARLMLNQMITHPKGKLVAAVHIARGGANIEQEKAKWKIVKWSDEVDAQESVSFDLAGVRVCSDIRISVFDANYYDQAVALDASGEHILAGKEPGCKFYFLFHTHFHREDTFFEVPTTEVDKAFKSPRKYNPEGSLTLHFSLDGAEARTSVIV